MSDAIDRVSQRRRRRDLGEFDGALHFLESSPHDGLTRLSRFEKDAVTVVCDEPLGSRLNGYGAPSWTAMTRDTVLAATGRDAELVVILGGKVVQRFDLEGDAVGYLRRLTTTSALVLLDRGRDGGRSVIEFHLDGTHNIVWHTRDLAGDLVVDSDTQSAAWTTWPIGTMPWSDATLIRARREGSLWLTTHGAVRGVGQLTYIDGRLWWSVPVGEWTLPVAEGEHVEVPDELLGEYRSDWCFGRSWMAPTSQGVVLAAVRHSRSFTVHINDSTVTALANSPRYLNELCTVDGRCFALGSDGSSPDQLFELAGESWIRLNSGAASSSLVPEWRSSRRGVPYIWWVQPHSVPTGVIVRIHGGPTAYASMECDSVTQLLCSYGFAVAEVDYRGSTSYGRSYRDALNGHWGAYDVDDVADVISHLVDLDETAALGVFVRGTSAGGRTALQLSTHPHVRGVVLVNPALDLAALERTTVEFEVGYVLALVGAPSLEELERRPSVVSQLQGVTASILVIQGERDDVVPAETTRATVNELRERGCEVTYVELPGERHSIRTPDNVRRAFLSELNFYAALVGPRTR